MTYIPKESWMEELNRICERIVYKVIKHVRRCVSSLVIREMQIKTMTHTGVAGGIKMRNIKSGKGWRQLALQ